VTDFKCALCGSTEGYAPKLDIDHVILEVSYEGLDSSCGYICRTCLFKTLLRFGKMLELSGEAQP
jgi:hypothetical protein